MVSHHKGIVDIPVPVGRFLWICTWCQLLEMFCIELDNDWSEGRSHGHTICLITEILIVEEAS
jgi:hypothetical protein